MRFKKGNEVVCMTNNYGITKKDNGYGIVVKQDDNYLTIRWITKNGLEHTGTFTINPKHFKLKNKSWKAKYGI